MTVLMNTPMIPFRLFWLRFVVGKGGRIAVAVPGLVEVEHHIAPPGEFDGKAILGFARIDVAVDRENARSGVLSGGIRRDVEQGAHGVALGARKADILDSDAPGGLRQLGQKSAGHDQNETGDCQ